MTGPATGGKRREGLGVPVFRPALAETISELVRKMPVPLHPSMELRRPAHQLSPSCPHGVEPGLERGHFLFQRAHAFFQLG